MALVLLAVEHYQPAETMAESCSWMTGEGMLVATVGGTLWVYLDPSVVGIFYWLHIFGVLFIGFAAVGTTHAIR